MNKITRNDLYLTLFALPLYFGAIVKYGFKVLVLLVCSLLLGLFLEIAVSKLQKKNYKLTALPVWILMPLVFSPATPVSLILISIFIALLVSVVFFGGYGYHLFSPVALVWAIGSLSFSRPFQLGWVFPYPDFVLNKAFWAALVPVSMNPLKFYLERGPVPLISILSGNFPQPLSNAVPLITISCGIILILLNAVDVRIIISFFITLFTLTISFSFFTEVMPIETILVGNTFFASFFILANRRIAPRTYGGRWINGILAGVLSFYFTGYKDGIFYAVLLASVFSPLIDEFVLSRKYKGG